MRKSGFTLIELSITLVIIGLLVGGVLVGKDLIEAAKIRSQVSQIEKYSTAVNTFSLKYNCLAGDCANASNFGFNSAGQTVWLGNQKIENTWNWYHNSEIYNFWNHLSASGLIDGSYTGWEADLNVSDQTTVVSDWSVYFPTAKIGLGYLAAVNVTVLDGFGLGSSTLGNSFVLTTRSSYGGVLGYGPTLTPLQAKQIDDKLDDGLPTTGKAQVSSLSYYMIVETPNAGVAGCTSGSPVTYAVTSNTVDCLLVIKF